MRKRLTPLKAIRASCLGCCGGSNLEVRECPSTDCPLWIYRMGKRPKDSETSGPSAGSSTQDTSDG